MAAGRPRLLPRAVRFHAFAAGCGDREPSVGEWQRLGACILAGRVRRRPPGGHRTASSDNSRILLRVLPRTPGGYCGARFLSWLLIVKEHEVVPVIHTWIPGVTSWRGFADKRIGVPTNFEPALA